MTRRRSPRGISCLLAAFFVLGLGGLPRAVLCIAGPDHLAVEIVDEEDCHPDPEVRRLAADDECPETCRDTPLGGGPMLREADPEGTAAAGAFAAPVVERIVPVALPAVARTVPRASSRTPSLSLIRTITLLC